MAEKLELKVVVKPDLNEAIRTAVKIRDTDVSKYIRRAVKAQLEADGVQIMPAPRAA